MPESAMQSGVGESRVSPSQARFLDAAAHELRGPMAVISGYLSMIQEGALGPVNEQIAEVLPVIMDKVQEMNSLLDALLRLARSQAEGRGED